VGPGPGGGTGRSHIVRLSPAAPGNVSLVSPVASPLRAGAWEARGCGGWGHGRSWLLRLGVPSTAQGMGGVWRCTLQGGVKPLLGLPKGWDCSGSDPSKRWCGEKLVLGVTG